MTRLHTETTQRAKHIYKPGVVVHVMCNDSALPSGMIDFCYPSTNNFCIQVHTVINAQYIMDLHDTWGNRNKLKWSRDDTMKLRTFEY